MKVQISKAEKKSDKNVLRYSVLLLLMKDILNIKRSEIMIFSIIRGYITEVKTISLLIRDEKFPNYIILTTCYLL